MKSKKYRKYILGSLAAISIIGIVAGTCAGVCYKNTTKSNLDNKTNSGSITSKNDSNATNQNNRTTKNDHDSIKTQNSGTNPDKNDREKTSTGSNNNPSSKNPNSTHNKESNSSPDISHSSSSQPPVGPGPVVNPPRPHHLNDLNYDLNINDNEVSPSSNIINLNYLTNSFSLSNIEYSNHLVDVTNGNCSLTYVITNLSDNKVLTTKNITSTSNSNWSSFSYDFAPSITTSTQSYSIKVTLLLKNLVGKNNIIKTTVYDFKITNPLQLSTSYGEKGSLEQLFEKQMLSWVGNSSSTEWYDFINQWYYWYRLDNVTAAYFDDVKVYFSQMPANDNYGKNEFLTIQATSTKPISMWWITTDTNQPSYNYPLSSSYGAAATWITPIAAGHIFTWTLPFELAQLTYSNGNLQLPLLSTSFWVNDYQTATQSWTQGKPEPFGLSIGTLSNPTAVSNDEQFNNFPNNYEDEAVFPTQDGVLGMAYDCPTSWGIGNNPYCWYNPSQLSYSCKLSTSQSFNNQTLNISGPELINFKNTATYAGQIVSSSNYPGTYAYSIVNKTADINVKNSGSLSGNSTLFNYYFDKPGEYEITITYVLNNVLGNKITNTEIYYINYQNTSLTTAN